jgi:hypothetical protein
MKQQNLEDVRHSFRLVFPEFGNTLSHLQNDKQITEYIEYVAVNSFDPCMHAENALCSCERP